MKRFIILAVLLAIFCQGCQDIYDFPEKDKYKKYPVIEALLTNNAEYQKIRVSFSTQFEDSLSCEPIADALVKIIDITGDTVIFQYSENGWYTNNKIIALPEKEYKLLVQIGPTVYQASSTMIPVNGLDSISYSYHNKKSENDSAYYPVLYAGISDPNNPKYYQLHLYKNHKLISEANNTLLSSDIATFSLNGVELPFDFAKGDTIDVELYSLTPEMYDYYTYIFSVLLFYNDNDLDYRTNPPIQFSPNALGYFQVSMLSHKRLIIK
jgi:hypothetical protein